MIRSFIVTVQELQNLKHGGIEIKNSSKNNIYHEIIVEPYHPSIEKAIRAVESDSALKITEFLYGLGCTWLYETTFVENLEKLVIPENYQDLLELQKRLIAKLFLIQATHRKCNNNKRKGEIEKKMISPLRTKLKLVDCAILQCRAKFREKSEAIARTKNAIQVNELLKSLAQSDYPVEGDREEKLLWIISRWGKTLHILHSILLEERSWSPQELETIKSDYNKIKKLAKKKEIFGDEGENQDEIKLI